MEVEREQRERKERVSRHRSSRHSRRGGAGELEQRVRRLPVRVGVQFSEQHSSTVLVAAADAFVAMNASTGENVFQPSLGTSGGCGIATDGVHVYASYGGQIRSYDEDTGEYQVVRARLFVLRLRESTRMCVHVRLLELTVRASCSVRS